MNETEIWKSIKGFPRHEISSLGRIKSYVGWSKFIGNKQPNTAGYLMVHLSYRGKRHVLSIHRLVLETFVGSCPNGHCANHKNGIKTDNRTSNLEWVKFDENYHHAYRQGTQSQVGERNAKAKLREEDIREIRKLASQGVYHRIIAERFGVSRPHIGDIVDRSRWGHV